MGEKILAVESLVDRYLGQQQPMTTHPLDHQSVPTDCYVLSQIERILNPEGFKRREHSGFDYNPVPQFV